MANLGGTYTADPDNVQGEYTPIPPGEYLVHIIDSDMKPNSANTGSYLQLEIEILEGDSAGRKLTERLNLDNPNEKAVEIAQRTLNALCVAVGKLSISDSNELHGIPIVAVVKVDPAKPYVKDGVEHPGSPQNSVRTYKPRNAGAAPAARTTSNATVQKSEASTPPWKKKAA